MSPLLPPYSAHSPSPRRRRTCQILPGTRIANIGLFFATAALSGILFHILVFGAFSGAGAIAAPKEWQFKLPSVFQPSPAHNLPSELLTTELPEATHTAATHTTPDPPTTPSPSATIVTSEELSLEELRDLAKGTNGFFVRDFSLGLGWNNVRYIIEAALIQAKLLNRVLVLPSFVYARACEYNIDVCADYAVMVNRGHAIGWNEWESLPMEEQMGWRIPMSVMLDMPLLRQTHPAILVSDYLRLHGLSDGLEFSNGAWQRDSYHTNPSVFETNASHTPSLYVIHNDWYDPTGTNRVDFIPEDMRERGDWIIGDEDESTGRRGRWQESVPTTRVHDVLVEAMEKDKFVLDFEQVRGILETNGVHETWDISTDEELEELLRDNGWEVLYTFRGALGMDYTKTVVEPVRQVVPRGTIRGFKEEYGDVDADVVLLEGETHLNRKPGALRFTTTEAREIFADFALHHLHAFPKVFELADKLAQRMSDLTEGRLWMGAHMRRGDFVKLGWAMESSAEAHIARVKKHLAAGRKTLIGLSELQTYDIPGAVADPTQLSRRPPLPDDPFYVATDERNPEALDTIAKGGAVFLNDLLTIEDRQEFGWPLLLTDVRALVEQAVLARSAYFYAHAMSSVAGGIMNMRAVRGADPRTIQLD
ncbi:hypothetical protein EWM64_g7055 [Hericium alpestre]|uniref:O-fucosyltransferase family protein n=1 Tax=Hericium alpestre TaxID=135208 RepID=A0A4Y9ZTX6_9AGAM|nr:hypothetical protein EWM64_g7055 [Hericium alpestre]